MKNKKFLAITILLIVALVCVFAFAACKVTPDASHECESKCPICHKCTNENCQEDACKDKCKGHENPDDDPNGGELLEYDMSGVTFVNKTVTYNGSAQELEIGGTLPEGVQVRYEYYRGRNKLESAPVDVGTYTIYAKFTGDAKHKEIDDKEATLTIEKATYDMSGVTFTAKSEIYTGSAQTIEVVGTLPQGVTVAYEYYTGAEVKEENKLSSAPVNVGVYTVVVKFTGDSANYNEIADKEAILTIGKATYDMSSVTFVGTTEVTYDGQTHALELTGVPAGVTVAYEYDNGTTKLENAPQNAGVYTVSAKFTVDANHNEIADKTATLTINKANIGEVVLGATKNADGNPIWKHQRFIAAGESFLDVYFDNVKFYQQADGSFEAYLATALILNTQHTTYTVELLSSDAIDTLHVDCYDDSSKVGKENPLEAGRISAIGDTVYVRIWGENYNELVYTVKGAQRVLEMRTYADLVQMANDVEELPLDVRFGAVYKLMNDIDCGNAVWQIINTQVPMNGNYRHLYAASFVSELTGKNPDPEGANFKIYNYRINEDSVKPENVHINEANGGMAIGFFGSITDANIHDVTFADITVDFSILALMNEDKYEDPWVDAEWGTQTFFFGAVAGKVGMDDWFGVGSKFSNINVENLNAKLVLAEGYVGTFFGADGGYRPEDYNVMTCERTKLVAKNININVRESLVGINSGRGYGYNMIAGSFVGRVQSYMPVVYKNCQIVDIVLTLDRPITVDYQWYYGVLGCFVGNHQNIAAAAGGDASTMKDYFESCVLANYRLENKSGTPDDDTHITCGWDQGGGGRPGIDFVGCAVDDADGFDAHEYGLFWYKWNDSTAKLDKYYLDFSKGFTWQLLEETEE